MRTGYGPDPLLGAKVLVAPEGEDASGHDRRADEKQGGTSEAGDAHPDQSGTEWRKRQVHAIFGDRLAPNRNHASGRVTATSLTKTAPTAAQPAKADQRTADTFSVLRTKAKSVSR